MNKEEIIKKFRFKDEGGDLCSFRWWRRWKIAKWHWRKWLEYEGMPKGIKDIEKMKKYSIKSNHFN